MEPSSGTPPRRRAWSVCRGRARLRTMGSACDRPSSRCLVDDGRVALSLSCAGGMMHLASWGLIATALTSALTAGHRLCVLLLPQAYGKARP
jgi:hypothetical protein